MAVTMVQAQLVAGGEIATIHEKPDYPIYEEFTPNAYVGLSGVWGEFSYLDTDYNDGVTDDNIGAQVQVGYNIFGYNGWTFGVEGRYGYLEVDNFVAVSYLNGYGKVEYTLDQIGAYGLLGYGNTNVTLTRSYYDVSADTSDFTWGAGVKYYFDTKFEITLDYVVLADWEVGVDTIDSDVVSLGFNYNF